MPTYRGITMVNVSNGATTLFWKDMWLGEILAETHPRAFSFAKDEDISVRAFLGATSLQETFHLPLSEQAHAETRNLQSLTLDVQLAGLSTHDDWTYVWGSIHFAANKFYEFFFRDVQAHPAYSWLWKSKTTMKIKVFGWLLLSDRLNTRNVLKQRHFNIGNTFDCMLCPTCNDETVEHLFFECPFSLHCWAKIGMQGSTQGNRLDWVESAKTSWNRPLFVEILLQSARSIWKERNNKHFRGITPSRSSWLTRLKEDLALLAYRVGDKNKHYIYVTQILLAKFLKFHGKY